MRSDYAKHKLSTKKTKKSYLYLWLLSLVMFGTFLVGLLLWHQYQHSNIKLPQVNIKTKIMPNSRVASSATVVPTFEFYDITPQNSKTQNTATYELAIATLDSFAAADHLKAELALLGFGASITPIYQQNAQKYQVSIGPYPTKEGATADQQKLRTNRIKSMLKKLR